MKTILNKKLAVYAATLIIGGAIATTSHAAAFLQFDSDTNNVVVGETFTVDIQYNFFDFNTGDQDLAAFDIDVSFNDSMLDFGGYSLGDGLGSISSGDADDWSLGHDGFGTINLAELSWLDDFSFQSDNFILASLTFTAAQYGLSDLDFTHIDLSDADGNPIAPPVFSGPGTVNAVPVPPAVLLLGSGLLGLIGINRRLRK